MNHYTHLTLKERELLKHFIEAVIQKIMKKDVAKFKLVIIQISNLITDRPDPANNRERLGDWEADTVMGQTGKACLVTLTDRKSRYLLCKKIAKKNSFLVKQAMIELL